MIYKILNIIALICILLNVAAHAEPTNPCAWSATHTIYDKESRGCVTPKAYEFAQQRHIKRLLNQYKDFMRTLEPDDDEWAKWDIYIFCYDRLGLNSKTCKELDASHDFGLPQ